MVFLSNFPLPTEGIRHQQVNTAVDIDGKDFGNGTLYISESSVAWQKESDGLGFSLLYPGISLHAISRDLTAFPHECLYLMIDGKLPGADSGENTNNDDEEEEEDEDEPKVTEIRFIPSDKAALEAMYSAMSACQALHPDPEDVDSEDDGEFDDYEEEEEGAEHGGNGVYHGEDGLAHLTAVGRSRMAHMEAMLEMGQGDAQRTTNGRHRPVILTGDSSAPSSEQPMDVGQFQDAEEME